MCISVSGWGRYTLVSRPFQTGPSIIYRPILRPFVYLLILPPIMCKTPYCPPLCIAPYVQGPLLCIAPSCPLLCIAPFNNRPLLTGGDTLWCIVPSELDSLLCIAPHCPQWCITLYRPLLCIAPFYRPLSIRGHTPWCMAFYELGMAAIGMLNQISSL